MTATTVMGLRVVEEIVIPTGTTIKRYGVDTGEPAMFTQIKGLKLENGVMVYGCVHCDYARENVRSVIPHLNKHSDRGDGKTPKAKRLAAARDASTNSSTDTFPSVGMAELRKMSVDEILRLVNKARRILAEGDVTEWKRRALKAEGDLSALRDLIRGTG